jgi:hypothetical protein
MKTWKQFACGILTIVAYGFTDTALWAQETNDEKPKPAARVLLPLPDLNGNQQDDNDNNQTMQPDRGPVAGVQSPTLGTSELRHSYWVPGVQYGITAQSNNLNNNNTGSTQSPGWTTTQYASGNFSLLEAWNHAQFGTNYSGGGFFSTDSNQGNGQYHQLASAFELDERRWQLLVMEEFHYLPQSAFGFGGTTALAVPGITGALSVALPGIQEVFAPGQSIYIATGPRYSNDSAAQLSYSVSRRGSFTVAAVYGFLRFSNPANTNNDTDILNAGYSYAITRKDYIGAIYRFTAFRFPGNPEALGDHTAQLMYGRRITGRLALNLAGGPDITTFRLPVNGVKQTISGSGIASLAYAFRVSSVRLNYSHGVGSGGGLLAGSSTDQLMANLNRPLSRLWTSSLSFGYVRNSQLVTIKSLQSPNFNSYQIAGGLSRPLSGGTNLSIGYQAQIQASNGILCTTTGCQNNQTTHQIQMSFQWHAPPQVLR